MATSGLGNNCQDFSLSNARGGYVHRNVIAILILDLILAACTITINSVFLFTIIRTNSLHTPANTIVCALFACDLFVGLFGQTLYLAILFTFEKGGIIDDYLNNTFETVFLLCSGFSSLVVALLSCDRFLAICYPYKYRRVATTRKYIKIIVSGSVAWSVFTLSLLALPNHFKVTQYVFFILIVVVMTVVLCTYFSIYRVIRRHRQTVPVIGSISETPTSDRVASKTEKEHSFIMAFIIGVFLVLHLPYLGFTLYYIAWQVPLCIESLFVMYLWDEFFLLLSSFTNPILYGLKRKAFRTAAFNLFKC